MPRNRWAIRLQYSFWAEAIFILFGDYTTWHYYRYTMLEDEYREWMDDLMGMYCAGGEL